MFVKIISSAGKYSAVKRLDKKLSLRVSEEMKASGLKRMIEQREHIPAYYQTLVYNGGVLKDDQSLGQYSIDHNSVLYLWPETLHPMLLAITIRTPTQTRELRELKSSTKIVNIKRNACLMDVYSGVSVEQYHLFYGPTLLENNMSLQDYMVTNGSELYFAPPEQFPIFVNSTLGSTFSKCLVQVRKTDEIKVIKNKIRRAVDAPHESLDLYLSSMILDDHKTVDNYTILAACSLTAVHSGEIPVSIKTRFATVPLAIDPSQPVESLMERISHSAELGISLHRQRLLFHHMLLSTEKNRHKTIGELNISAGSTLNLVVTPGEMELYTTLQHLKNYEQFKDCSHITSQSIELDDGVGVVITQGDIQPLCLCMRMHVILLLRGPTFFYMVYTLLYTVQVHDMYIYTVPLIPLNDLYTNLVLFSYRKSETLEAYSNEDTTKGSYMYWRVSI